MASGRPIWCILSQDGRVHFLPYYLHTHHLTRCLMGLKASLALLSD